MQKILVIGGAGYIGSHICKYLSINGYEPICYDNLSTGNRQSVKWGTFIDGDIRDQKKLEEVISKFQPIGIMHFAADSLVGESVLRPGQYYHNNVLGALSLLEAMRVTGLRSLVFSSTCNIYEETTERITEKTPKKPVNPYGKSKLMVEMMLEDYAKAYEFNYAALRYFNAAGCDFDGELREERPVETHLIPLVMEVLNGKRECINIFGNDYLTKDGTGVRDYVHVWDLADAHLKSMEFLLNNPNQNLELNLGSGIGYSVKEVIDMVENVSGGRVNYKLAPRREGDLPKLVADARLAEKTLGWKTKYSDLQTIIDSVWRTERKAVQKLR